jgi:hypothetical protein
MGPAAQLHHPSKLFLENQEPGALTSPAFSFPDCFWKDVYRDGRIAVVPYGERPGSEQLSARLRSGEGHDLQSCRKFFKAFFGTAEAVPCPILFPVLYLNHRCTGPSLRSG